MSEKTLNTRIINKHDIEANWLKATTFVPKIGEIIVYDADENYSHARIKIGDGNTKVNDLPFSLTQPDWRQSDEAEADFIKNRTHQINYEGAGATLHFDLQDMSFLLAGEIPEGVKVYASETMTVEGSAEYTPTAALITLNGNTYYSSFLMDAGTFMFGDVGIFARMGAFIGQPVGPEELQELKEMLPTIEEIPFFLMSTGAAIIVFTLEDYGETFSFDAELLHGTGEIQKLSNVFLDDRIVKVTSNNDKTFYFPSTKLEYDSDMDAFMFSAEGNQFILLPKNEYCFINYNGIDYQCRMNYAPAGEGEGYAFGNLTAVEDAESLPEGFIGNSDAPFYGVVLIQNGYSGVIILPLDGASEVTLSIYSMNADGWLTKEKDGTVHWEEKTHGYVDTEQVVLPLKEYSDEELEDLLCTPIKVEMDSEYRVDIGDEFYICTAQSFMFQGFTFTALGSPEIITEGGSGYEYPFVFLISSIPIEGALYFLPIFEADYEPASPLQLGITQIKYLKKLDPKYIEWPDDIVALGEKDGNVYLDTSANTSNNNSYYYCTISNIVLDNLEVGAHYTLALDNNSSLVQCFYYPGDIDMPESYILVDPIFGGYDEPVISGIIGLAYSGTATVSYFPNRKELQVVSLTDFSQVVIRDKQVYTKKINKYAIPNNLPLMRSSGADSICSTVATCNASGNQSIALRVGTSASGYGSIAIGRSSTVNSTVASGAHSIAIHDSRAKGGDSIAINGGITYGYRSIAHRGLAAQENSIAINTLSSSGGNTGLAYDRLAAEEGTNTYSYDSYSGDMQVYPGMVIVGDKNTVTNHWYTQSYEDLPYVTITEVLGSDASGTRNIFKTDKPLGFIIGENPQFYEVTGALGENSMAVGSGSVANGKGAFALAGRALMDGAFAYSGGTASGYSSHASGLGVATGILSFAHGNYSKAEGMTSLAFGASTKAAGNYSIALGSGSDALGEASFAWGTGSEAKGRASYAGGHHAIASGNYQHVLGKDNKEDTENKYVFIIGNGEIGAKSNALTVNWNGNTWVKGSLFVGGNDEASGSKVATEAYVGTAIAALVNTAPEALNTLNELAAALGNDPNFATTVATEIGKKADKKDLVALTEAEILEVCGVTAVAHISEVTW